MAKPFTLQPLVNLAKEQNDAAIQNLGKLNRQHQSAQAKLDMLKKFRSDYQEKFQEAARNGISPVDLRNFQNFIYRLDQAIEQQQNVTEHTTQSVNTGRLELKNAQRKKQSFDTLAQRHVEGEKKQEAKAEQKKQDEYSGRFAAFKTAEKIAEESGQ